jgi:hypothetical protein
VTTIAAQPAPPPVPPAAQAPRNPVDHIATDGFEKSARPAAGEPRAKRSGG